MFRHNRNEQASLKTGGSTFLLSPTLSVIIPIKGDTKHIGHLTQDIKRDLAEYSYETLIVDDGAVNMASESTKTPGVKIIRHNHNLGKGAAMKTGAKNAIGDILIFLDGDGAHNPKDIITVITPILERRAELVIGSRTLKGSHATNPPLLRRLANNLASVIISFVVFFMLPIGTKVSRLIVRHDSVKLNAIVKPVWISDCTSGFRAISRKNWQKLNLVSEGFQIETEMIYEAVRNGLTITEVPISCVWYKGTSHLSIWRDGLRTLITLGSKLINEFNRERDTVDKTNKIANGRTLMRGKIKGV